MTASIQRYRSKEAYDKAVCFLQTYLYSKIILQCLQDLPGVAINGQNINNIRYTDDTVLITSTRIDKVEQLGSLITSDGRYEMEIRRRINMARSIFG